jgi:hypothetical protein
MVMLCVDGLTGLLPSGWWYHQCFLLLFQVAVGEERRLVALLPDCCRTCCSEHGWLRLTQLWSVGAFMFP